MGPLLLPRVKASSRQPPATNGDSVRDSYESSTSSMNGTGDVWTSKEQPGGGKKSFSYLTVYCSPTSLVLDCIAYH
jgi:hypothetical protein